MAYIVPMHVKPKFTYLLTYLLGDGQGQAITSADKIIQCHMVSLGHSELTFCLQGGGL